MYRGKALLKEFCKKFSIFYSKLPPYVQKQDDRDFVYFESDARYPGLEFKCVNQQAARYSIRINHKGYRALGRMKGDIMYWYWIGPHDEYERRINEK